MFVGYISRNRIWALQKSLSEISELLVMVVDIRFKCDHSGSPFLDLPSLPNLFIVLVHV